MQKSKFFCIFLYLAPQLTRLVQLERLARLTGLDSLVNLAVRPSPQKKAVTRLNPRLYTLHPTQHLRRPPHRLTPFPLGRGWG